MYDIRIYDFEFNLLHIEPKIISSNWTVKYNGIGSYEGHFDINGDIVPIAIKNRYIIVVQGDYQAIVTGKRISAGEFILYGKTVNWILSRRVTPNFVSSYFDGDLICENEARKIVSDAFSDVDNFVLGDKTGDTTTKYFWRNTYNPTSEVVADCLDNANLGHNVVFDRKNKRWVFNVLKGQRRNILICTDNKNAYDTEYNEDLQDYYSECFYEEPNNEEDEDSGGANEDEEDEDSGSANEDEDEEGKTTGVWHNIVKDSDKTGIYRWECIVSEQDKSSALSALAKKSFDEEISTKTHDLICGKDYNIGDIVRVRIERGKYKNTQEKRIVGVNLWYENNNIGQEPIFNS